MLIADFALYLITDRRQTGGRPLTDVVRQALDGGVRAVQLREKDLASGELYRLAGQFRRLTGEYDARLIINDRCDIALAVGADGVHIGTAGLPVTVARQLLGRDKIVIYSAHGLEEALCVQHEGADAITFGPLFHTPSKTAFGEPCGVKKLAEVTAALVIPVLALGGISSQNITEALSAQVEGIAVISAVSASANPREAAASLLKKIEEHAQHS